MLDNLPTLSVCILCRQYITPALLATGTDNFLVSCET